MRKMILFFFVTGLSMICLQQVFASLDEGLVAYYTFNGNADDQTGNGHNGIIHGGTALCNDRLGYSDSAYCFDGDGDYIEIGEEPDFPSWESYAVSLWFLHDGGGDTGNSYGQKIIDKTVWYHDFYLCVATNQHEGCLIA